MEKHKNIIPCVILAGGMGRRMGGKQKALINLLDRPLLSHILEKISGKVAPIALNTNTNFKEFEKFVDIIEKKKVKKKEPEDA